LKLGINKEIVRRKENKDFFCKNKFLLFLVKILFLKKYRFEVKTLEKLKKGKKL
jgi:hypothetical protein